MTKAAKIVAPVARKAGGKVPKLIAGNKDVVAEAKSKRADGGKVIGKMTGGAVATRADRPARKAGGAVAAFRTNRAGGGGVGANTNPLSTAHNVTSVPK